MTSQQLPESQKEPYVLFHHAYSICSIMVRYTLALRGIARDPADEITVEEHVVEIFQGAQLSEEFLCYVNPKGQVPVLYNADILPNPLADSLYITLYIAERYPTLLPAAHKDQILFLLHNLHDINYFSISFGNKPGAAVGMKAAIERLLAKSDLSELYKDALEYKLNVHAEERIHGVDEEKVRLEVEKTESLLAQLESAIYPTAGPWLFGLDAPTALDAHLVPFLVRLQEVGRAEMVSEGLKNYVNMAIAKPEWKSVMDGRKTMFRL